jgi:hypothetical protein
VNLHPRAIKEGRKRTKRWKRGPSQSQAGRPRMGGGASKNGTGTGTGRARKGHALAAVAAFKHGQTSNDPTTATRELRPNSTWKKCGGLQLEELGLFKYTRVVDVRWLLSFAKGEVSFESSMPYPSHRAVPAWQDVPANAIVPLDTLRDARMPYDALPILVLSYGWESIEHPDPQGHQLSCLLPVLASIVAFCDEIEDECQTFGIVWDYLSLPQRGRTSGYDAAKDDRTPEQLDIFKKGLSGINVWYGAPWTTVLLLDTAPRADATNRTPYENRGWVSTERVKSWA